MLRRFFSSIASRYERKTAVEHVLLRPDSYVGSVLREDRKVWAENGQHQFQLRQCSLVPALVRIFDEILVNAADNWQRDPRRMTRIDVDIDPESGWIRIRNNGRGIPVTRHPVEKCYVPELVLGNLLTGSNFDESRDDAVTGGRNGFGAKLCNIFSTRFLVDTVDRRRGLHYRQQWTDNMAQCDDPVIEKLTPSSSSSSSSSDAADVEDYTAIEFWPDLTRFGVDTLVGDDVLQIWRRRVHDVAVCLPRVQVRLNGQLLNNDLATYASQHEGVVLGTSEESGSSSNTSIGSGVVTARGAGWRCAVAASDVGEFLPVSFVNCVATTRGGSHVTRFADPLVNHVLAVASKQVSPDHADVKLKPAHARQHLAMFLVTEIANPAFDSQAKEALTAPRPSQFPATFALSQAKLKQITDETAVVPLIHQWVRKTGRGLLLAGDQAAGTGAGGSQERGRRGAAGRHGTRVLGIEKLLDARLAGGANSHECTLILTEGDSAKALAVAGLTVLGRDRFGVFPLRGKLLNVRDVTSRRIASNTELQQLKTILGLQYGSTDRPSRYGKVMLMTDQDPDGSHIKGLFINYVHKFWPHLLKDNSFLQQFSTPLVKAFEKGKSGVVVRSFYGAAEFSDWLSGLSPAVQSKLRFKYYKGLGTNTSAEAREYFSRLDAHRQQFVWPENDDIDGLIEMAFARDLAHDRREWLRNHETTLATETTSTTAGLSPPVPATAPSTAVSPVLNPYYSFRDFVDKELVVFSRMHNVRSIPSVMDGLKPGQRKVLFACFKRNLRSDEMKVAQLAGYVAEHTNYHHGEASLAATIVGMAQDYVGSNNVPLLEPVGQFGTRHLGGQDAASPRYLFTRLDASARVLFKEADDNVLVRVEEDGQTVEPVSFMPVIPTVLVNGAEGIGTGWSTSVPPHNPLDIISALELKLLSGRGPASPVTATKKNLLAPWFRGFSGRVEARDVDKQSSSPGQPASSAMQTVGLAKVTGPHSILISELPIRRWTTGYKVFLEQLVQSDQIRSVDEAHTETLVNFEIRVSAKQMIEIENQGLESFFKLKQPLSLSNMHLFDAHGQLRQYETAEQILDEFYQARLPVYSLRKNYQLSVLSRKQRVAENKIRFLELVLAASVQQFIGVSEQETVQQLRQNGFDTMESIYNQQQCINNSGNVSNIGSSSSASNVSEGYDYLLSLPIRQLTADRLDALRAEAKQTAAAIAELTALEPTDLWLHDLQTLRIHLVSQLTSKAPKKTKAAGRKPRRKSTATAKAKKKK